MMTQAYGASPDPSWAVPDRQYVPYTITTGGGITVARESQKATVAARVDENGRLWLRISIDGRHIAEIEGDPSGLTLTVDL